MFKSKVTVSSSTYIVNQAVQDAALNALIAIPGAHTTVLSINQIGNDVLIERTGWESEEKAQQFLDRVLPVMENVGFDFTYQIIETD